MGAVVEQDARVASPRERFITRARRWAARQVGKGRPIKDMAEELGCSWYTVNLLVRRWGEALLEADRTRVGRVEAWGRGETSGVVEGTVQHLEPGRPVSSTHPKAGCSTWSRAGPQLGP